MFQACTGAFAIYHIRTGMAAPSSSYSFSLASRDQQIIRFHNRVSLSCPVSPVHGTDGVLSMPYISSMCTVRRTTTGHGARIAVAAPPARPMRNIQPKHHLWLSRGPGVTNQGDALLVTHTLHLQRLFLACRVCLSYLSRHHSMVAFPHPRL